MPPRNTLINRRQLKSALAFAALFLTIFLSCHVKQGLQHFFDGTYAKPLNSSKTTVNTQTSCHTLAETSLAAAPETGTLVFAFAAAFVLTAFLFPVSNSQTKPSFYSGKVYYQSSLPLFLLYRKLLI
jgi:hypothetical protein